MGEPFEAGHPRDVLERVRQLEAEVQRLRAPAPSADELLGTVEQLLATDRQEAIEDLECLLEVVAAGWRSTRKELDAVRSELAALRTGLAGASFELQMPGERPGNGSASEHGPQKRA